MFERQKREWCAARFSETGPVYHLTAEGKRAPIRRVDIHDRLPEDLAHDEGSRFTPAFVLFHDGQEVGRIRGCPGEDFFRGLLGQLMQRLPLQS